MVHYKDTYIYTHIRDMVRQENAADLSNLFILFNGIPKALQPVVQQFEEHVKEQGGVGRAEWAWLDELLRYRAGSIAAALSGQIFWSE